MAPAWWTLGRYTSMEQMAGYMAKLISWNYYRGQYYWPNIALFAFPIKRSRVVFSTSTINRFYRWKKKMGPPHFHVLANETGLFDYIALFCWMISCSNKVPMLDNIGQIYRMKQGLIRFKPTRITSC